MKKAVKAHENFKFVTRILRANGMDAKKGRLLLKRHYVALLEHCLLYTSDAADE